MFPVFSQHNKWSCREEELTSSKYKYVHEHDLGEECVDNHLLYTLKLIDSNVYQDYKCDTWLAVYAWNFLYVLLRDRMQILNKNNYVSCMIYGVFSVTIVTQELLKLEKLHEELVERCGCQPTIAQWAAAAGLDRKTLRKRLNHGIRCKDKMIKSNIRLVISIAKNYQGAGMNLQDLVQVVSCVLVPFLLFFFRSFLKGKLTQRCILMAGAESSFQPHGCCLCS